MTMDDEKRRRLESKGWQVGSTDDFLGPMAKLESVRQELTDAFFLGYALGLAQGFADGRRATIRRLLRLKFGALSDDVLARVDGADAVTLDRWEERILTSTTLDETLS
jgi:hypothetical protein